MSLASVVDKIESVCPTLEGVTRPSSVNLDELLEHITDVRCTAAEFQANALRLSADEAKTLLTATLHRDLAYGVELMPLEQARHYAQQLVEAAGPGASFLSNCRVTDEVSGVGGWYFMVTNCTFESVLLVLGERESALLVAAGED